MKQLKKSMNRKPQPKPQPIKRREMCRILNKKGYKRVPTFPNLFLNDNGNIYNLSTGKELKPTPKGHVIVNSQYLSLPKLVLLTFKKEQIRSGQIKYIDGNKRNLNPQNLQYVTQYPDSNKINYERLKIAIQCYFEVGKQYNVKDYTLTRIYLKSIIERRCFYMDYANRAGMDIFKSYMNDITNSRAKVAKVYDIPVKDCDFIVNDFTNLLINDILIDLEIGILTAKEYHKPKTQTQTIREINEYRKSVGHALLPLRKSSDKEKINKYLKHSKSIQNGTN